MQYPERPDDKYPGNSKNPRGPLALRLDRAANDVNPFLVVLAAGLMILNITLYLGMAVSRQPFVWTAPHEIGSPAQPAALPSEPLGYGR
jgi:hypothetical protein